jgi:mercuric ion transport protein
MQKYLGFSYLTSISSLGVATCCILPMTMIFIGLGGSWLAIFGKIAATSFYVLAASSVILAAAWIVSLRRGSMSNLKWWLGGSTMITSLAWVIVVNETRINDFIIMQM